MIILLSPSKTLDFESPLPVVMPTQPRLLAESSLLVNELRQKSVAEIGKLMSISEKLAQLNYDRFQQWKIPFTPQNARPCFYAFKGDVYEGLEAESFDAKSQQRAQENLRILSGLYGLLRPLDLIQPYRLEMSTKLTNPRGKNLYQFWGERITQQINADLEAHTEKSVINLASGEYFSAVQPKALQGTLITPVFKEAKGNQLKVVGLFAKRARGRMAQYLLKENISTLADLKQFGADGYRFQPELSSKTEIIFTRKQG
jgi:cytoplasmic iron level regulating protein YaaA (DUF328/UPF0246 family)